MFLTENEIETVGKVIKPNLPSFGSVSSIGMSKFKENTYTVLAISFNLSFFLKV